MTNSQRKWSSKEQAILCRLLFYKPLITFVEVTPSCGSDEAATLPTLTALSERKIQPKELIVDTNYASAENAIECEKRGTELVRDLAA